MWLARIRVVQVLASHAVIERNPKGRMASDSKEPEDLLSVCQCVSS